MEVGAWLVFTEPSALELVNVQLLGAYSSWKPNTVTVAALALEATARVSPKAVIASPVLDQIDSRQLDDWVVIIVEIKEFSSHIAMNCTKLSNINFCKILHNF